MSERLSLFHQSRIKFNLLCSWTKSFVESKYQSTKLKMIALVWFIQKLRFIIISFEKSITIYIDYAINAAIVNQIKLISNNVDKLNLKLIRIFMYLFQFRLKVFHRSSKFNLISNVLNKLSTIKHNFIDDVIDSLDIDEYSMKENHVVHDTLIEMWSEFRKKLFTKYEENHDWKRILQMFRQL